MADHPSSSGPKNVHADTLIAIMPLWLVVMVGVLALGGAVSVLEWAIYQPERFEDPFPRAVFAVLISFALSIGLFVLFPALVRLRKLPFLPATVEVVGPV